MRFLLILTLFLLLPCKNECAADITKYVDEDGIVHYVDTPKDKRFIVFMRDVKPTVKNWFAIRRDNGECTPHEAPADALLSSNARVVDEVTKDGKPAIVTVRLNANDVMTYYKTIELCQKEAKRLKRSLDKYR